MWKFLSSTAGASFNQELPTQTVCVRKDCVELIYKVKPSVYVIVSMLHVGDGEAMLFVNWGRFSLKVEIPSKRALLECITPELFSKGRLLANKCLKMYAELQKNPPFPAWKDGLDEVWN